MNKGEPNFSRRSRKKDRNRMNNILNISIAVVLLLIIITATMIFRGNDDKKQADEDKDSQRQ